MKGIKYYSNTLLNFEVRYSALIMNKVACDDTYDACLTLESELYKLTSSQSERHGLLQLGSHLQNQTSNVLFYYVSLRSEFRVVMSGTISA